MLAAYIREHPGETLRRTSSKLRITLQNDDDGLDVAEDFGATPVVSDGTRDLLELAADAFYVVVAAAAIAGGVVLLRRPDPARRGLFLVVAGAAQLISPLATFGDARFKMPIYPTLAICAAVAVVQLWEARSSSAGAAPGRAEDGPGDGGDDGGEPGSTEPTPSSATA